MKLFNENSRLIRASFGSREMFSQWFTSAFGLYTFFFYESVIGLPSELALAAFLIFSVWNAVNDPLVGYLMEKIKMPWQRKSGLHRFPWILIGGIPFIFAYLFIFLVPLSWHPPQDTWKIFAWYVGSLLLFDTFFTLYEVNATSLFPVKFRTPEERRVRAGLGHAPRHPWARARLRDHRDDRQPEPPRELPPGSPGVVRRRLPALRAAPAGRVREQAPPRGVRAQPAAHRRRRPAVPGGRAQGAFEPHGAGEVPLLLRLPGRRGHGQRVGDVRDHLHPRRPRRTRASP